MLEKLITARGNPADSLSSSIVDDDDDSYDLPLLPPSSLFLFFIPRAFLVVVVVVVAHSRVRPMWLSVGVNEVARETTQLAFAFFPCQRPNWVPPFRSLMHI